MDPQNPLFSEGIFFGTFTNINAHIVKTENFWAEKVKIGKQIQEEILVSSPAY